MDEFEDYDRCEPIRRPNSSYPPGNKPRTFFWSDIKELPDPEWLVKGVLECNSIGMIFGPYGCGKSFLVADLGVHIALGWDWQGHRVTQGGVLYVCVEGGSKLKRRGMAFQQHYDVDLTGIPFGVVKDSTNIFDPGDVDQLLVDANAVPKLRLIIIDTANRVMPGSKEDTEDMGKLIKVCERLQAETGATIFVVHHTGKDEQRGSRGGYNLPAAMDTTISVTRDKSKGLSSAVIDKQRDGPEGHLLTFCLKIIEVGTDEDGEPVTSCVIDPVDAETVKKSHKLTNKQQRAMDVLRNLIIDQGKTAPNTSFYPIGATVVPVGTWREYLFSAAILDASASNHRQDFKRLRDGLSDKGAIREWDGLMWAVQRETDGEGKT